MAVVKGEAYWACVQQPNMENDPPSWNIKVKVDDETIKRLEEEGLDMSPNKHGDIFFKAKVNVERKNGMKNRPPLVVDAKKQPFTDLIGNGSIVKVQYSIYDWTYKGRQGKSANLIAVQVLDLIPYDGGAGQEFDEEDGYDGATSDITDAPQGNPNDDDVPY